MSLCEPASKLLGTSAGQFINIAIYCQSTLYLLNVHVDMSYLNILLKYRYIVSINYRMHIAIIECIFCTCISSIRGQVFGVKTYSCVSLFYVCHCTNPTHYRYIGNMEFTMPHLQYVHSHSSKSGAYWIDHPLAIVRNFKFILSPFTNIASVI